MTPEQPQEKLILCNMLAEALLWLQFSRLQERVETAESRVSVLETMIDDLQWDIDKIRKREQRLNRHLADVLERVSAALLAKRPGERGWCWMGVGHPLGLSGTARAENCSGSCICCITLASISLGLEKVSCIFLQVNSKGYKVYGAGSSLYGGTITINARKVKSGAWLWAMGRIESRRTRATI